MAKLSKSRIGLYILVCLATMNSCQTMHLVARDAGEVPWYVTAIDRLIEAFPEDGVDGQ